MVISISSGSKRGLLLELGRALLFESEGTLLFELEGTLLFESEGMLLFESEGLLWLDLVEMKCGILAILASTQTCFSDEESCIGREDTDLS